MSKNTTKPAPRLHTPGPWHRNVPPAKHFPVIYAGRNNHVAMVDRIGHPDEEIEANADLIAAAPALLEAAEKALEKILAEKPGWGDDLAEILSAAIPRRREPSKKAAS